MSPLDVLRAPIAPISLADGFDFQQIQVRGVSLAVDADARSRVAAASEVAGLGAAAAWAIPFLIEMLDQDRVTGNTSADQLLAAFTAGGPTKEHGRQALNMASIGEADLACQVAAQDALASLGSVAVPALTDALRAPKPNRRIGAAKALGTIGQSAAGALPLLSELAKSDPAETVRKAAAAAVKQIKPRSWFSF